jgi:hypothetical protein
MKNRRSLSEDVVMKCLERQKIRFYTKGWPDLLCEYNGELLCIEIKRDAKESLKWAQIGVMRLLQGAGIRCVRWDPDRGFTDLNGEKVGDIKISGLPITIRRDLCDLYDEDIPLTETTDVPSEAL